MEIQQFDRQNLKQIRQELELAIKSVSEKFGINLQLGNIGFQSNTFSTKLTASIGNALKENKAEKLESAFKLYARLYGLEASDYNRVFNYRGTDYKIVGLDTKKHKNNIILERVSDGKSFAGSPDMVKNIVK